MNTLDRVSLLEPRVRGHTGEFLAVRHVALDLEVLLLLFALLLGDLLVQEDVAHVLRKVVDTGLFDVILHFCLEAVKIDVVRLCKGGHVCVQDRVGIVFLRIAMRHKADKAEHKN